MTGCDQFFIYHIAHAALGLLTIRQLTGDPAA